jgi:hypothetical protein
MAITQIRGENQIMAKTVTLDRLADNFIPDNTVWVVNDNNLATIRGIAAPSGDNDAATKWYVDNVASGLEPTHPVLLLEATTNLALTGNPTIDNVATADGDRVLLTAQTDKVENGIWVVDAAGWTRPTDFDTGESCASVFTFVEEGDQYHDTGWVCTADPGGDVIDTDPQDWVQFSAVGQVEAGAGLLKTGSVVDVVAADSSLQINADDMKVRIGDTNGDSLETTTTGVELRSNVTGDRSFTAGDFTVDAGSGKTVSIKSGVNVDVDALTDITFSDAEVKNATTSSAIPFAMTPTADYGNGNGTAQGDSINQFRDEFTDDAIINALIELKARVDNNTSKLTPIYNETPTVTNNSPTVQLAHLGSHPTDKVVNLRVYVNGSRQNPGSSNDYTYDASTGEITFTYNLHDNFFGTDVVLVDYETQDA